MALNKCTQSCFIDKVNICIMCDNTNAKCLKLKKL